MDYVNRYIHRLSSKGNNPTNASINKTKQIISEKFNTSPSYTVIKVNDVETEVIVNLDTKYDERQVFFKPDYSVNIGDVVNHERTDYLVTEFYTNEIYPKATIKQCNQTLILPGEIAKVQIGTDSFGRPIFKETQGEPTLLPCIVESTFTRGYLTQEPINLPEGKIIITIPYSTHKDLILGGKLPLYEEQYQITGIDKTKSSNNIGLLIIHAELEVNSP